MNHYLLQISYNGAPFSGWQRLSNQPNTIQQLIEDSLSQLLHETIRIHGSGRTDAKVNAISQYADFFCHTSILTSIDKMIQPIRNKVDITASHATNSGATDHDFLVSINQLLPADIRICSIKEVPASFHSRKSCTSKTYQYCVSLQRKPDVFASRYVFSPYEFMLPDAVLQSHTGADGLLHLNEAAMTKAAKSLCGTHDYTSYTSDKTTGKSHTRTVTEIQYLKKQLQSGEELLIISFTGNGFLYNMVRILAGTLLYVGLDQINAEQIKDITKAGSRKLAGPTLPAHALFLSNVSYDSFD